MLFDTPDIPYSAGGYDIRAGGIEITNETYLLLCRSQRSNRPLQTFYKNPFSSPASQRCLAMPTGCRL